MLKNYLLIAWRNIRRYRAYAFISIASLAIGLAVVLLIGLFVAHELSYDRFHSNADRIYRVAASFDDPAYDGIAKVTGPWGPTAAATIPEVEASVRFVFFGSTLAEQGNQRTYLNGGRFVDPAVLEVFDFPGFRGDPETALARPGTLVLTRSTAEQFFGDTDPIGQTLVLDEAIYTVTGLLDDVPTNAHFSFTFLTSLEGYEHPDRDDWVRWNQFYTYLLLRPGSSVAEVERSLEAMLAQNMDADRAAASAPFLQPLTRIHLHSNLFREMQANGNILYVYLFGALAAFILLIAVVNFMNLTTARATTRAREVGIRKAAGAQRSSLIQQFLSEAALLSLLALLMAIVLAALVLPSFSTLTGTAFSMAPFQQPLVLGILVGGALLVGLLAGSYPALVLSRYTPAEVLYGSVQGAGGTRLRQGLVIAQFALSIVLITTTLGVQEQLGFIQSKRLGFNQEHLVTFPIRGEALRSQADAFKAAVREVPGVIDVAASGNLPGGGDWGIPVVIEGFTAEQQPPLRMLVVDPDFVATYQMTVVEGRDFASDRSADVTGAVLLNEAAVAALEWEGTSLDKTIAMPAVEIGAMPVVGVVEDFHFRSLHETISPLMFFVPPTNWMATYSVRIQPDRMDEALAGLEGVWASFDPEHPFTYSFLDASFAALYATEQRTAQLLNYAAGLAILIACLGLFGLAAFTAERRTKEVGVRKVLGASVPSLVALLARDFLVLVGIAFVLAVPAAWLLLSWWMDRFAYSTTAGPTLFVIAGTLALAIALFTISYQAIRTALADPVDSLRYE